MSVWTLASAVFEFTCVYRHSRVLLSD